MKARLLLLVCCALPTPGRAEDAPSFRRDVAPLLQVRCLKCHHGTRARGDLDLTTRERLLAVLVPGKAADSRLFQHVRDGKMPPRDRLSAAEVERLRRWIDAGARWEGPALVPDRTTIPTRPDADLWSLRPIRRPTVPTVRARDWVRQPLDAFLLARLEEHGLTFAPEADRRTLIRRVTFDLIGLPPTPEEVEAFVRDERPDAYERLVDRLLASPHHGERWGRHWLDVVRFAESHGYEMNTLRPNAWPYRDYVIRAFNHDIPYAQFVREQLAGDVLAGGDARTAAATGFLVGGPHDMVGNATEEGKRQQRADDLADMVATTGTAFLGLTVGCARCHDHKFDPITQKDFHALQAIFSGVEHAEREWRASTDPTRRREAESLQTRLDLLDRRIDAVEPIYGGKEKRAPVHPLRNVERFSPVRTRFVSFTITATLDGTEPCIDELEVYGPDHPSNLALARRGVKASASSTFPNSPLHRLEHLHDGRLGNARSWISAERGKGWVILALPEVVTIDRIVWSRDREGRYRDRLARDYRVEVSLDGKGWTKVAGSDDRLPPGSKAPSRPAVAPLQAERQRLATRVQELSAPMKIYAGTFRTPDVSYLLRRGDVMQRGEPVGPGTVQAVTPTFRPRPGEREADRRLALADWLTDRDNPLVARVLVNRVWHWHFGQGLVRTPSDLGTNGDRPSHPELLDWLAHEFLHDGSMKRLHRLIVTSSAYRQSSRFDERAAALDAGNRWLWRATPRRLEAEAVRDAILAVSGSLDRRLGGPGYHLWDYSGYVIVFKPKAKLGPDVFRRMVYQFKPRLQQDGTFGAFDCPDGTAPVPRRHVSTTALQALNLLNDPLILDQAERFAARLRQTTSELPAQVSWAFQLALGRAPAAEEAAAAQRLAERHGLAVLCRALFNAGEFVFVH